MSILKGIGASGGIAKGPAALESEITAIKALGFKGEKEEKKLFEAALLAYKNETERELDRFPEKSDERGIFEGHISIAEDFSLNGKIYALISENNSACCAVADAYNDAIKAFLSLNDEQMRERADDIKDVKNRLLSIMTRTAEDDIPEGSIIVKSEIFPSEVLRLRGRKIRAVITQYGSSCSHSAILLRAMKIPYIFGVENALCKIKNGDMLIVNGNTGEVALNSGADEEKRIINAENDECKIIGIRKLCSIVSNEINENILKQYDGVGLFRTEFLFMNRKTAPNEEEQFKIYSSLAEQLGGREVIIRTLDISEDKQISYLNNGGLRGISFCLNDQKLFSVQLRALLRAAAFGNIKILLPFITSLNEVKEAKKIIVQTAAELENEETSYRIPPVGIMVETPSAAVISDLLAEEADFFSVGTNDLISLTMALSRAKYSKHFDILQPAVLRLIKTGINNAKKNDIPIYICGEAAANPAVLSLNPDGIVI